MLSIDFLEVEWDSCRCRPPGSDDACSPVREGGVVGCEDPHSLPGSADDLADARVDKARANVDWLSESSG